MWLSCPSRTPNWTWLLAIKGMEEKKMTTTKREKRIAELMDLEQEWNLSRKDTLYEYLYDYMAHEFAYDDWDSVLGSMSEDELLEVYLNT